MICSDLLVNYNIFIVPTMPDPLDPSEADAVEFFDKQLHEDGLRFTWAHAVNSQRKLDSAVKGL